MKRCVLIAFVMLIFQGVSAQEKPEAYKFGEYDSIGGGCSEWGRVADFLQKLSERSDSRGLVVVYASHGEERLGNIRGYVAELKNWILKWEKFPQDRIDFVVTGGKKVFSEDYWIIPGGAEAPEFRSFEMDWAGLRNKYFFSLGCPQCEPSYPFNRNQVDLEGYVSVLLQFPTYKGEIVVGNFDDLLWVRNRLTKDLKLPRNHYVIKMAKSKDADNISALYLYITPTNIEEK
jgi:hypothetical protein